MTEVCVQGAVERESSWVSIKGAVDGGFVADGLAGEAGDELVGEADALGWTERVAEAVAVVLVESLVVVSAVNIREVKEK